MSNRQSLLLEFSTCAATRKQIIRGKAIVLARQQQNEQQQRETRYHVSVKLVERLMQQVPKSDDSQYKPKRNQRHSHTQPENYHRAGDQLHKRNDNAHRPKRPDW